MNLLKLTLSLKLLFKIIFIKDQIILAVDMATNKNVD